MARCRTLWGLLFSSQRQSAMLCINLVHNDSSIHSALTIPQALDLATNSVSVLPASFYVAAPRCIRHKALVLSDAGPACLQVRRSSTTSQSRAIHWAACSGMAAMGSGTQGSAWQAIGRICSATGSCGTWTTTSRMLPPIGKMSW